MLFRKGVRIWVSAALALCGASISGAGCQPGESVHAIPDEPGAGRSDEGGGTGRFAGPAEGSLKAPPARPGQTTGEEGRDTR